MLKGINKQILEVTSNDSPYFEKIIFFVRPEGSAYGEQRLQKEAEKVSGEMRKPPKVQKSAKEKLSSAVCIALGLAAGAAMTVIMGIIA